MSWRRTLASLIAAGATAGAVAGVAFFWLVESGPEPQCSSGLDGLGCELAAIAGMALLALLLAAAANYAVLRRLGVDHAGPVGVLAVLALAAWSVALDQAFGDGGLRPLTLALPVAVINVLLFVVMHWLPRERWATPVLAIGVIAVAWPLTGLSGELESHRYVSDQADKIRTADFEVYEPLAVDGYTAEEVRFVGPYGADSPYAEWWAFAPAGNHGLRDSYTVRSFRLPDTYDPPTNCGHDRPYDNDHDGWRCSEVARTDRDEPVYVDPGATFSNVQVFYIQRGSTLITVSTGVPRGLTAPQVADLANRLQTTN